MARAVEPADRADRNFLARIGTLLAGIALVAAGEVLNLTHVRECHSTRASACWAGPVPQALLIVGLCLMIVAAFRWQRHRSLRWWDWPIILVLVAAAGLAIAEVQELVEGDAAWDGQGGPINVLVFAVLPFSVFLAYFTLRMRSGTAIVAAVLTTVVPFILLIVAIVVSGGGS